MCIMVVIEKKSDPDRIEIIGAATVNWATAIMVNQNVLNRSVDERSSQLKKKKSQLNVDIMNPYNATNVPLCTVNMNINVYPGAVVASDPNNMTHKNTRSKHRIPFSGIHTDIERDAESIASEYRERTLEVLEKEKVAEYAKVATEWWSKYSQVRECNINRVICLMAKTEYGQRFPLPSFIRIIKPCRSLPTPREAARYVSLLRERDRNGHSIGEQGLPSSSNYEVDSESRVWCTNPTIIFRKTGSVDELSTLLCSLFLGFGLNAYVCIGLDRTGKRTTMVLTRPSKKTIVLWNPLTGIPFGGKEAGEGSMSVSQSPLQRIHFCFNGEYMYANQQADDSISSISWCLEEETRWAVLDAGAIVSGIFASDVLLMTPPLPRDAAEIFEKRLEDELKYELFRVRQKTAEKIVPCDVQFKEKAMLWDEDLSALLMPALDAYEQEAKSGISYGNSEFQQSIKRKTPVGHTFKGFPFHTTQHNAKNIVYEMMKEPSCAIILGTSKEGLRFALRSRVTYYPNGIASIWIMLAICYRGVEG